MSVVVSEGMFNRRVVEEGRKGLASQGLFQKESFTGGMVHRGPNGVGWYKRR